MSLSNEKQRTTWDLHNHRDGGNELIKLVTSLPVVESKVLRGFNLLNPHPSGGRIGLQDSKNVDFLIPCIISF